MEQAPNSDNQEEGIGDEPSWKKFESHPGPSGKEEFDAFRKVRGKSPGEAPLHGGTLEGGTHRKWKHKPNWMK